MRFQCCWMAMNLIFINKKGLSFERPFLLKIKMANAYTHTSIINIKQNQL